MKINRMDDLLFLSLQIRYVIIKSSCTGIKRFSFTNSFSLESWPSLYIGFGTLTNGPKVTSRKEVQPAQFNLNILCYSFKKE